MHRLLPLLLLLATALSPAALAQPQWQTTGTVRLTVDGEESTLHTYAAQVDEDLASKVEDEAANEFAQRVAGTEQHSATLMFIEATKAGSIEIVPAALFVNVSSRASEDPSAEGAHLDFSFALDPKTLKREAAFDAEVKFYPESLSTSEFYALTDGNLVVESVEAVGERTLSVSGSISGTLTFQQDASLEHNPGQALPVEATFDIEQAVGTELLADLLTGEEQE